MAQQSAAGKKWQEFPALEATRRMNSLNNPAMFEGLASSQIAFAAAMADMMRAKDGPQSKPKAKAAAPPAPAAFDKDMLTRLAAQAAAEPVDEEPWEAPAEVPPAGGFQLPPGFSLVSFETEEEAAQALQEMDEEERPPPPDALSKAFPADPPWSEDSATKPAASSAAMGPARGWGRPLGNEPLPGSEFGVPRGEVVDPSQKTEKVRSIVDNILGKVQSTAASSAAAAAVAPPVPKASAASRSSAQRDLPPAGNDIYLPASASGQPGSRAALEAVPGESREKEDREEKSWEEIRRRRGDERGNRSRSRQRSPSRRRGRSGDRGRRQDGDRRRRSRSASRRRSRSRKPSGRASAFGSSAAGSKPAAVAEVVQKEGDRGKFSSSANVQLNPKEVPDWLKDLAEPQINRALLGRKVLRMPDAYIKCLIGRGGETIRNIINKTGADIRIEAKQDNLDGVVSIANNIEAAERLIKEVLASKGCHWSTQMASDMGGELTNVGWKGHVDDDDLQIPTELVGLFIGNAGAGIKEIKARVGGAVTIKVLPPLLPGGFQVVQVVGENWKAAREVVRAKIKQILQETPGRWHAPGFSPSNPNLGGGAAGGAGGGAAANAGYMPGFGATPGMSYSREALREGNTVNAIQGTSL